MSAGEFAFLVIGLLLGIAVGTALVVILRARPPAPRQIRLTIAPGSVPTRAPTLAADPFGDALAGPAPFGPGDRRLADREMAAAAPVAASAGPAPIAAPAPVRADPPRAVTTPRLVPIAVGMGSIAPGSDAGRGSHPFGAGSLGAAFLASRLAAADAARRPSAPVRGAATAVLDGTDVRQEGDRAPAPASSAPGSPADPDPAQTRAPSLSGPCAELIAVAQDRCAVADRARGAAEAAQDALRQAQRSYDEHQARSEEAEATADPRQVRAVKEAAQIAFRNARDLGGTREAADGAAATWLQEINRINQVAREASTRAARERAAANALVVVIERLAIEADAARIGAETAAEACLAAREAVADCQEAEARGRASAQVPPPPQRYPEESPELDLEETAGGVPRILRILQGDGDALVLAATELGGDDLDARRDWQLQLARFSDAVTATAIDANAIDLPDDHPFFAPFTRTQRRDIISALASLGYRYDGLGGFDDGRIPSQRDLSLAVGYAGLDPMRIRRWPSETEMPELLAGVTVTADEYLAEAAGGLSLGELVALLGRRADGLTDLWNDWGRVRAHLLVVD